MELFIRGTWFHLENVNELYRLFSGSDIGEEGERNLELGRMAYEVYCCRLSEHQPTESLSWDRLPPYMHDVWAIVGEVIGLYVRSLDRRA